MTPKVTIDNEEIRDHPIGVIRIKLSGLSDDFSREAVQFGD